MTDQPIKKFMNKLEVAGRMVQWEIELRQFDIEYHPRIAIKAQALVDFITEFTIPNEIEAPEGETLKYRVQLKFPAANNKAEYEGILDKAEGQEGTKSQKHTPSMRFKAGSGVDKRGI